MEFEFFLVSHKIIYLGSRQEPVQVHAPPPGRSHCPHWNCHRLLQHDLHEPNPQASHEKLNPTCIL